MVCFFLFYYQQTRSLVDLADCRYPPHRLRLRFRSFIRPQTQSRTGQNTANNPIQQSFQGNLMDVLRCFKYDFRLVTRFLPLMLLSKNTVGGSLTNPVISGNALFWQRFLDLYGKHNDALLKKLISSRKLYNVRDNENGNNPGNVNQR